MNIVITGSNGFIGHHLIQHINQTFPESNISCLVRKIRKVRKTQETQKTKKNKLNNPNISYHYIDYSDLKTLQNVKPLKNADYIFHLAGATKGISKEDFINGNVVPTKNLLETIKNNKNLKRFLLISSLAASGPSECFENPKNEKHKNNPVEFYGESKLMAENITMEYFNNFNIPTTIIRPSAVYGPHDKDFLNIFKMINKNFNIFHGNKKNYMSLIFVQDLVEGIIQAGTNKKTIGKTYYLTHSEKISWLEFNKISADIMNKKTIEINIPKFSLDIIAIWGEIYSKVLKKPYIFNRQKIKLAKHKYWLCSHKKASTDFGFIAKKNLRYGLKKTLDWYKKNKLI